MYTVKVGEHWNRQDCHFSIWASPLVPFWNSDCLCLIRRCCDYGGEAPDGNGTSWSWWL